MSVPQFLKDAAATGISGKVASLPTNLNALTLNYDVVVYGATPSGIMASVAASKGGLRVLLISPNGRIGGIDTAGLSRRDYKGQNPNACMNMLTRQQRAREAAAYGVDLATFTVAPQMSIEPKIAERCYKDLLNENEVPILRGYRVQSVIKPQIEIEAIVLEYARATSRTKRVVASVFIDASYEADLMMRAGVTYTSGREANATYSETLSGVRGLQVDAGVTVEPSPYLTDGVSASGLLPFVNAGNPPTVGTADTRLQAFNHRLITTTDVANQQAAWPDPLNYNPTWYELHGRTMANNPGVFSTVADAFLTPQICTQVAGISFTKFDWNNNLKSVGSDFIGGNVGFVTTDYAARQTIIENHFDYTLGYIKFLRTDARVPTAIKNSFNTYRFTKDEFASDDYYGLSASYAARLVGTGMSPEVYVREAARMVGDYVEHGGMVMKTTAVTNPIAYGNYPVDSHFRSRWEHAGTCRAEGAQASAINGMFGIDYRVLLPKSRECTNLLVSCNGMSVSSQAWNSIRMEHALSSVGEAAGWAAYLAIKGRRRLHDLSGADLQPYLQSEKLIPANIINLSGASAVATPSNATLTVTGTWSFGLTSVPDYLGVGYASDQGASKGSKKIKWSGLNTTQFPAGRYRLRLNLISDPINNTQAACAVNVKDATGTYALTPKVALGKPWFLELGIYQLAGDGSDYVEVVNSGDIAGPLLLVDALHLEPVA